MFSHRLKHGKKVDRSCLWGARTDMVADAIIIACCAIHTLSFTCTHGRRDYGFPIKISSSCNFFRVACESELIFFLKNLLKFLRVQKFFMRKNGSALTHIHTRQVNRIGKHTSIAITIKWHANAFDFHIGSQQPLLRNVKTIVRLIGRNESVNREIERTNDCYCSFKLNGFDSMRRRTPLECDEMWLALALNVVRARVIGKPVGFVTFEKIEKRLPIPPAH